MSASISARKAPMDPTALSIALGGQGHNVLPQMIEALHAFRQTDPLENADLDLGYIEPTAMLGRVMHLQSVPDTLRFLRRKRLIEAHRGMCVEIAHHQADHPRFGIDLIHQPADRLNEIQLGVLLGQLNGTATGHRKIKSPPYRVRTPLTHPSWLTAGTFRNPNNYDRYPDSNNRPHHC